ncbi:MAG: substrate-binding domain-containing protein [Nocardioides alkalitolerans]
MTSSSPRRRAIALAASTALAASALAACGTGSDSAGPPASQEQLDAAAAAVEPYRSAPTSIGADEPVSAPPSGNKTIAFLSCNVEVCIKSQEAGVAAAEAIGWEGIAIPFDGTPEDVLEKVRYAIDQGVDGIAINGVPSATFEAAYDEAEAAGIPIVLGASPDVAEGPIIAVQDGIPEFTTVGEVLGNYIIADSEGDANVLLFEMANFPIGQQIIATAAETIEENCSSCSAKVVTTQVSDIGTTMPSIVVSEVQRSADVNYVAFADSVMTGGVAASLREGGVADRVRIVGANASSASLENVRNGTERGYVQFSVTYFNWQAVDAFVRHFNGDPQIERWEMPLRLVTAETVEGQSEDELLFDLPADMSEQFLALWQR